MTKPIVTRDTIRLAMLGMVDGNGHPYSWSAIFNGYNPEAMAGCPYAGIPDYLNKQPKGTLGIPGAKVTHVWTDDPKDAAHVAACSLVPNVVKRAEDVIGQVDAVIVATDKGHEHVARCRPFVEAGLPVFVDKPMVDNEADLAVFNRWVEEGRAILTSSCMRYAKEYMPFRASTDNLGELRYASITTPKSWERYGIHALEGIYPILGPGFLTARNTGTAERNIVHFTHRRGADVVVAAISDMYGTFGALTLGGTKDHVQVSFRDSYFAFKAQLVAFVEYLRTGERPFPWAETDELMRLVIAGLRSREQGGAEIRLGGPRI
jgi:predicted dehydrogenase